MVDLDTFVTLLYVTVDDFCKERLPPAPLHPGRHPSLSRSEVVTLALVEQWATFRGERAFYRYARGHLLHLFPHLPDRSQFNRLLRAQQRTITLFGLALAQALEAFGEAYEVLDCTAAPTRNAKRRGRGWLPGQTAIGYSNRLGWYHGFRVLLAVVRTGVITGFGFAPANEQDRELTETFLEQRHYPTGDVPSVGAPVAPDYLADAGFASGHRQERWREDYGAELHAPPQVRTTTEVWTDAVRTQAAGLRQIVETVNGRLLHAFRLNDDRPHHLSGFGVRLAAKVALHNFCIWLNRQLGQPDLCLAELIDW
jgi:Transposase DDE domain